MGFSNCHMTALVTKSKGHMGLMVGASNGKLASGLVWCPWVLCKWRYKVFNLSCDFLRLPN